MSNKAATPLISLPKGGGAQKGIGETFSPDLFTGTGNFTVPIALPAGRNGFQPEISLVYSSGNGNSPFGLGWSLSIPGVMRKTSKGIPRYRDDAQDLERRDTFVLSGAEDLFPVTGAPTGATRYRPRTEGLFALIDHFHTDGNNYWKVQSKDGLVSFYGTPRPSDAAETSAVVADPVKRNKVFAWKLTRTQDVFGNHIIYEYERDAGQDGPHHWDELYLRAIKYVDYTTENGQTDYLVLVTFHYEDRPDPSSDYRAGFEIRTRKRCTHIEVHTHAEVDRLVRTTRFIYLDQRAKEAQTKLAELDAALAAEPTNEALRSQRDAAHAEWQHLQSGLPLNGSSLLSQVKVIGHDGDLTEELPPLEFGYSKFELEKRNFFPLRGRDLPAKSLGAPDHELVDLFGNGLPDIMQMNGTVRYWRNLGNGEFDLPRQMKEVPLGISLADANVQMIDADGDGRIDLMATDNGLPGYYSMKFNPNEPTWDHHSFKRQRVAPSFNLADPEVKLMDLDGDGITDAIRSGNRMECFFNDPKEGWSETRFVERRALEDFPNVNFSDPRVRLSDMCGDGLTDIVLIHDGKVEYWPNLGDGNWGKRVIMRRSPRFPHGYDPRRILLGDVDGDGVTDMIYVDHHEVTLWINQKGNGWSDPIVVDGTPDTTDMDAVRLADMLGTGLGGILWSRDATAPGNDTLLFLDITGGRKPYLLHEMNNHMGAITRVQYEPSTRFYLEDQKRPETRWQTPLPMPVLVVARTEVIDEISGGKLTTEYSYHHGYWDGAEREFRGFGRVDQRDTETFPDYHDAGLHPGKAFEPVEPKMFTPPLETRSWFHLGPVGNEFGDWQEPDYSREYWSGDPVMFERPAGMRDFLKNLPRRVKRDALRTLRGSMLRTELYALDGSERENRPYTVTESLTGLREEVGPGRDDMRIFFPFALAQRTTQWERGDDPMTQFSFTEDYEDYGQPRTAIAIACPRTWRRSDEVFPESSPFLATVSRTEFAYSTGEAPYLKNRTAKTTAWELQHKGDLTLYDLKAKAGDPNFLKITAQNISYYDGEAFTGLPFGQIGSFGAAVRSESLIITEEILHDAWKTEGGDPGTPVWLQTANPVWPEEYPQVFREQLPPLAGYAFYDGSGPQARGYWVEGGKTLLDVQQSPNGRGLPLAMRDALDRETTVEYDRYQLLPEKVTDPLGLTQRAWYDYRVLQPYQAEDANANRSRFTFSPLGLATAFFVNGKEGEIVGDTPEKPSRRLEYDFFAFMKRREPVYARSIAREYHAIDTDAPAGHADDTITTVEYSDGFGRLVQTRVQAEEVLFGDANFGTGLMPADITQKPGASIGRVRQPGEADNVVVSGWKIYNNKGLVVQQYEPYYDKGFGYATPEDYQLGQKAEMHYDPRGQVIRTVNPDGSEQRVIYGIPNDPMANDATTNFTPTPWEAYTYDANDLAPICTSPEGTPLIDRAPQEHHFTPASIEIDALGRTIKAVQRNRNLRQEPGDPLPPLEEYVTRSTYDIRGNLLTVTDALGRIAFRYTYDLTFDKENGSRPWRIDSIDAGLRRVAFHALGMEVERRDSKGSLTLQAYDRGNRPTHFWARNHLGESSTLRQRLLYGDTEGMADNFKGKLYRHYDEAGLVEIHGYDFKGNPLATSRRTIRDEAVRPFLGTVEYQPFTVDWARADAETHYLETKIYRSDTAYDALNRSKRVTFPQDISGKRKVLVPTYNRAGALESVALQSSGGEKEAGVEYLAYNAKGQRTLLALANGLMTRYEYDPHTFRLARLRTEKYRREGDYTFVPDGGLLQDLAYSYDLAGNITHIQDHGTGKGINGIADINRDFTYDAIYRLLSGTGIEHKAYTHEVEPWLEMMQHHTDDVSQARHYRQRYTYDPVGNILELAHRSFEGDYTRSFAVQEANNRLLNMKQKDVTYTYAYDANGNMTREASNRRYHWNHTDQLARFRNQPQDSAPTVDACYLYGADGIRVKKIVLNGGSLLKTTTYIGEVFEYCTRGEAEHNMIHLMDGEQRLALLRVGAPFSGDEASDPALQYILGDHLGNSSMTANALGALVHREEFTPYGETSFGGYAYKRYRFTGKERDEESGLSYHRARYYAGWLGKWVSADPAGMVDGVNLYKYSLNNPVVFSDTIGKDAKASSNSTATVIQKVRPEDRTDLISGTTCDPNCTDSELRDRNNLPIQVMIFPLVSVDDVVKAIQNKLAQVIGNDVVTSAGLTFDEDSQNTKLRQNIMASLQSSNYQIGNVVTFFAGIDRSRGPDNWNWLNDHLKIEFKLKLVRIIEQIQSPQGPATYSVGSTVEETRANRSKQLTKSTATLGASGQQGASAEYQYEDVNEEESTHAIAQGSSASLGGLQMYEYTAVVALNIDINYSLFGNEPVNISPIDLLMQVRLTSPVPLNSPRLTPWFSEGARERLFPVDTQRLLRLGRHPG